MKKKVLLAIVGIAILIVVALAAAWCLGAFGPSPLKCAAGKTAPEKAEVSPMSYAPEGTDAITYINFKKICSSKIGKALLADEKVKKELAKAEKESGLTEKELTSAEIYWFYNFGKDEQIPQLAAIVCTKNGVPQKALDSLKKDKFTVDGKPAAKDDEILLVALSKNMLQISKIDPRASEKDLHALKKGKKPALAKEIDTGALISTAFRPDADSKMQLKAATQGMLPDDLELVTANVREKGKNLVIEVVGTFQKADSAKQVDGALAALLSQLKQGDAETAEMLKDLKIEAKGKKLVISLKIETDKVVTLIKSTM